MGPADAGRDRGGLTPDIRHLERSFHMESKSFFASKINWTQIISFIAMVGALFGLDLSPELQGALVTAIGAVAAVVTIVWRTWFTTTVIE
jgi:hypothetical protein